MNYFKLFFSKNSILRDYQNFEFSKQNINGCVAGLNGDELTVDYRYFKELLCQQ